MTAESMLSQRPVLRITEAAFFLLNLFPPYIYGVGLFTSFILLIRFGFGLSDSSCSNGNSNIILSSNPSCITCQFCQKKVKTKTSKVHWKTLHSPGKYMREIFLIILFNFIPLMWPISVYFLMSKPWMGTKHVCPKCDNILGIHFHSNYTGMSIHPHQSPASIPHHPGENRTAVKAF